MQRFGMFTRKLLLVECSGKWILIKIWNEIAFSMINAQKKLSSHFNILKKALKFENCLKIITGVMLKKIEFSGTRVRRWTKRSPFQNKT